MKRRRAEDFPGWLELVRGIGIRLRELRLRAGLTQTEVARRLGKTGPGGKSYVCQIERGYWKQPTIDAVADYLCICGAGFTDLADIFDRYTSRKPILEDRAEQAVLEAIKDLPPELHRRALYYDVGMRYGHGARVKSAGDVSKRVTMALKQARALTMHRVLNRRFNDVFCDLHVGGADPLAVNLKAYGRKVFALLRRFRGRKSKWLDKQLAALDDWPIKYKRQPEPFLRMKQEMIRLLEEMEQQGELG